MAVFVRQMVGACPMPTEALRVTAGRVVRLRPDGAGGYGLWTLVVNGAVRNRPGKTGGADVSLVVDNRSRWPLVGATVRGRVPADGA